MTIEIELKFLVSPTIAGQLPTFVEQQAQTLLSTTQDQLINTYYDTDDRAFRRAEIGLRTRCQNSTWQQTIKTAGSSVGGLHQRPEYNIPLDDSQVRLDLFSADILPPQYSLEQLQTAITPLFTTDFNRRRWQFKVAGGEVEMVFDQGYIASGGAQVPICEIEIELLAGDSQILFDLANQLISFVAGLDNAETADAEAANTIRLGYLSKAARGYLLLSGKPLAVQDFMDFVSLPQYCDIEMGFVKCMSYGLAFVQHHEQCYVDNPSLWALRRFADGVALIRHIFWLFSMLVPTDTSSIFRGELKWLLRSLSWVEHGRQLEAIKSKTGMYRNKLDLSQSLLDLVFDEADQEPDLASVKAIFSSPRYLQLILDLTRWLMNKSWRQLPEFEALGQGQGQLQYVAKDLLTQSWQSLLDVMPQRDAMSIEDYIYHHKQLKRSLLTGTCFADLFDAEERRQFRMPWVDLSQGIDELETLCLLQQLAGQVEPTESDHISTINKWLHEQIEGLLGAMEQSRKSAVKIRPYWL